MAKLKLKFHSEDGWILFAILSQHERGAATIEQIIRMADMVNHAILNYDELRDGLTRLCMACYVIEENDTYSPSKEMKAEYDSFAGSCQTLLDELGKVIEFLCSAGKKHTFDPAQAPSLPGFSESSYAEIINRYTRHLEEIIENLGKRKKT